MLISYLFGILLGTASFFSKEFLQRFARHKSTFTSFTVGLATVYVFLQLLPEAYQGIEAYGILIFLSTLVGFSIFHLSEQLILKHEKKSKLKRDLGYLHLAVFFFYHAMVGIALVELLEIRLLSGILFGLSLSFVYLTTSVLFEDLHAKESHALSKRLLSSGTFLVGVILANVFAIKEVFVYPALGFVSGVLIYIIGKEVLPRYKASSPLYFTLGVLLYAAVLITLHQLGLI